MDGHWYGESGFSYLNLLKKGTEPIGNALWFRILYDGENDTYYDNSPDASSTSIISKARRGSELPSDLHAEPQDYPGMFSISTEGYQTSLADDGSVIDILIN